MKCNYSGLNFIIYGFDKNVLGSCSIVPVKLTPFKTKKEATIYCLSSETIKIILSYRNLILLEIYSLKIAFHLT